MALTIIETQAQQMQNKSDALKDLRIAVDALKRDAVGYEILLNSILGTHDKRPLEKLCNRWVFSPLFIMLVVMAFFV